MTKEYIVGACSGKEIIVKKEQIITVTDIEGGQVVDFFAETQKNRNEFLSTGVTVDCNESLRLSVGDYVYSNLYNPILQVIYDDVGEHDLLHPCCRPEMYEFFYKNGKNHKNCLDNINSALSSDRKIIHPLNLFMYTKIEPNGKISVEKPLSKAGDKIILQAKVDLRLGIAACSVSESNCNSGKCTAIKVTVSD